MAKKFQVPVLGGLRKVINPAAVATPGTTIAGLGSSTVTLAQLRALLADTVGGSNLIGDGSEAILVVGAGLSGGGVLLGPVQLRLDPGGIPGSNAFALMDDAAGGGPDYPSPILAAPGKIGPQGFPVPMRGEDGEDPWPAMPGVAGARGQNGITLWAQPDDPDDPLMIPGLQGIQGIQGPAGSSATSSGFVVLMSDSNEFDESMLMPALAAAPRASSASSALLTALMSDSYEFDESMLTPPPFAQAFSANPSAQIGLTAVNGTARTFMTSDSAPALSQGITPTWTGGHVFDGSIATAFATGTTFQPTFTAAASSRADALLATAFTAVGSYTLPQIDIFEAQFGVLGAGSALTNLIGFRADVSLGGVAANAFGFLSNLAAGSNQYNFYASGTAPNYFAGATTFNSNVLVNAPASGQAVIASGVGANAVFVANSTGGVAFAAQLTGGNAFEASGAAATQLNALVATQGTQASWFFYQPAGSTNMNFNTAVGDVIQMFGSGSVNIPTNGATLAVGVAGTGSATGFFGNLLTQGIGGSGAFIRTQDNTPLSLGANGTNRAQITAAGNFNYTASVLTGTSVPTIGTNKPGSAVTLGPVTWETVVINGTTYYRPLWQ
jgi:hypothetical protein